mmetsp:Transcript_9974/g.14926  ORF Transcript_9974/g.14926 Transcript_9974/m.14926 type:complete len:250 (-) Transcript_9974:750-1499(-)
MHYPSSNSDSRKVPNSEGCLGAAQELAAPLHQCVARDDGSVLVGRGELASAEDVLGLVQTIDLGLSVLHAERVVDGEVVAVRHRRRDSVHDRLQLKVLGRSVSDGSLLGLHGLAPQAREGLDGGFEGLDGGEDVGLRLLVEGLGRLFLCQGLRDVLLDVFGDDGEEARDALLLLLLPSVRGFPSGRRGRRRLPGDAGEGSLALLHEGHVVVDVELLEHDLGLVHEREGVLVVLVGGHPLGVLLLSERRG